jgi:hypothetical protein
MTDDQYYHKAVECYQGRGYQPGFVPQQPSRDLSQVVHDDLAEVTVTLRNVRSVLETVYFIGDVPYFADTDEELECLGDMAATYCREHGLCGPLLCEARA